MRAKLKLEVERLEVQSFVTGAGGGVLSRESLGGGDTDYDCGPETFGCVDTYTCTEDGRNTCQARCLPPGQPLTYWPQNTCYQTCIGRATACAPSACTPTIDPTYCDCTPVLSCP